MDRDLSLQLVTKITNVNSVLSKIVTGITNSGTDNRALSETRSLETENHETIEEPEVIPEEPEEQESKK